MQEENTPLMSYKRSHFVTPATNILCGNHCTDTVCSEEPEIIK